MDISLIKAYERNAKEHNSKQIKLIANSIKRFGFLQPIVIDKNNEIVVGHGRYLASKLLDLKDIPVIQTDNLSDKEIEAYRIADNKINMLTGFKNDLLMTELKGFDEELLNLTGFTSDDLKDKFGIEGDVEFTTELLEANNYIVIAFDNIVDFQMVEDMFDLKTVHSLDSKSGYERAGIGRVISGKKFIEKYHANSNTKL